MNDETRRDLFTLGMHDAILSHFTVSGPRSLYGQSYLEVIWADFTDGEDCNVSTNSTFSQHEWMQLRNRFRDESKLYHIRGEAAGHELIQFLGNSVRFEQHIRNLWCFRLYYGTKNFFRKAFARLAFWRYTWITTLSSQLGQLFRTKTILF